MRLRPLLLSLSCLALLPSTAAAATAGDTLLASGLPGLGAPDPADFAFNVSGQGSNPDDPAQADITADGTKVVFTSLADGLVTTPEARRYENAFVKDRATGTLTPVAPGANGSTRYPSISDDGTKVVFETTATNLVPSDTTPDADVVLKDLTTGLYKLLSSPGDDGCQKLCLLPQLSGNGLYAVFATRAQLLPAVDANTRRDIYRVPTGAGAPVLVDRADGAAGAVASTDATTPSISDDGARVSFQTSATALGAGASDGNGSTDVYLRDIPLAKTVLISAADATNVAGSGDASDGRLSGNGQVVAFTSTSSNLVGADPASDYDVYARTIGSAGTGTVTRLVSRASGVAGAKANQRSYLPHINDAGTLVTFVSEGTNLGGGFRETYARTLAGTTTRLGAGPSARVLELDGTGSLRLVSGGTFTPQLEPGLSVVNAGASTRQFVSRDSDETPLTDRLGDDVSYYSGPHAISATGRFVAFVSSARGLPGARDYPDAPDLHVPQAYRRDQQTGAVELLSGVPGTSLGGDSTTVSVAVSADGNRVAFTSYATLLAADTNGAGDVYVRDVAAGVTSLASRADGPAGADSLGAGDSMEISGDGRRVAFTGRMSGSPDDHIYLRDLEAGTTALVDRADGAAGAVANGSGGFATTRGLAISGDGTKVAFTTNATNLGDGDTDTMRDIHLRDVPAGTTSLVSRRTGAAGAKGASLSQEPTMSSDGRRVAFTSYDAGLDPSAGSVPPFTPEVYLRDLTATITTLVSRAAGAGPAAASSADSPALSADGTSLGYSSRASNLGNSSGENAVFVRRLATGAQSVIAVASRPDPSEASVSAGALQPSLSADGGCVTFTGFGTGLVAGVSPDYRQLFTRVLSGDCGTVPDAPSAVPVPVPVAVPAATPPSSLPGKTTRPEPAGPLRPRITSVRLSRSTFRVLPRSRTKARKLKRAGTQVSFRLNTPATVTVVAQRRTSGRKVGRSCRKATKKLRKRKRCTRYVTAGRVSRKLQKAGTVKLGFSGRFGRRALAPGRYRFSLVATAGRLRSPTVTKSFRIVR